MKYFIDHLHVLFFFVICLTASPHYALAQDKISISDVLISSATHYPEIQSALTDLDQKQGLITESLGAFDASIEGEYYNRFNGFYDGTVASTNLVKPFQDYGAKLSLGYRKSDGDFPVYEDVYFTNDGGEVNASLSLSLLRNRDIDPKRFKLNENQIKLDRARIDLLDKQLNIQSNAYKAYLEWLATGKEYKVYQELLNIAEKREKGLKRRVSRGDLAKIFITENKQFILQRREAMIDAKRKFDNAGNKLSLFLRDEDGLMLDITHNQLPKKFPVSKNLNITEMENNIDDIIQSTPTVQRMDTIQAEAQNQIKLGENDVLPAIDLTLKAADDFGNGRADFGSGGLTREEAESSVRMSISIPLQKRFGQGKIAQGKALEQKVGFEKNLMIDKLEINFRNLMNNLKVAKNMLSITSQEINVTAEMEKAERIRFENGQSDFFLVNIRETNRAKAKINNIKADKYLSSVYSDYLVMSINLNELQLATE